MKILQPRRLIFFRLSLHQCETVRLVLTKYQVQGNANLFSVSLCSRALDLLQTPVFDRSSSSQNYGEAVKGTLV